MSVLKHRQLICQDVIHVEFFTEFNEFWVSVNHGPSNMGKEISTICVMRISVGVVVFVMQSMILNVVMNRIHCCGPHKDQQSFEFLVSLEGMMSEVLMSAYGHSKTTEIHHENLYEIRSNGLMGQQAVNASNVNVAQKNHSRPKDFELVIIFTS